jgi:hypothetical protein
LNKHKNSWFSIPKLLETRTNFKNFWQGFLFKNLARDRARNSSPEILAKNFSFGIWEVSEAGRRQCGEKKLYWNPNDSNKLESCRRPIS